MIDSVIGLFLLLLPVLAFSPSPPKAPPPPPPPPGKSDAEVQAEKVQAARAIKRRRGRASTILAGEGGGAPVAGTRLGDVAPSAGAGKTTLG